MLKAVIIGFGGIAQAAHVPGWKTLGEKGLGRLVAVYDVDPAQFTKKQEINIGSGGGNIDVPAYTDLDEMLAKEKPDVLDICAPTPFHASISADLLRKGYHVHCEKPMARTFAQCREMIEAANTSGRRLMIGQCLRFSSQYLFLKQAILDNTFGRPVSAVFRRLSGPPVWAWDNWFMDHARSGGCLLDMHIHDVDIIRFLFGEPKAVSCVTQSIYSGDDVAHSRLIYDDLAVFAVGDWSQQGAGFTADYHVGFEKATVILEGGEVKVFPREGEPWTPELSGEDMYMKELEYFITTVIPGGENTVNAPESAAQTVRLMETLKQSAVQNGASLAF